MVMVSTAKVSLARLLTRQLMVLKALDASGAGSDATIIVAID